MAATSQHHEPIDPVRPSEGCSARMTNDQPCGRSIHYAPEHDSPLVCLMHSRSPKKNQKAFQAEFEDTLRRASDGLADFTGFVFPNSSYARREFKAHCVFSGATFRQDADFSGATFAQDANFNGATFTQDANFDQVTFTQNAKFSEANFTKANFYRVTFTRDANFREATFTQDANFFEATFTQDADFNGVTFTQYADFFDATFTRDGNFSDTTFSQNANFRRAIFTQYADFFRATFTQHANFFGATFTQGAIFYQATFTQDTNFGDATFLRGAYFMRAQFLGAAEFRETKFRKDDKRLSGPVFSLAEFSRPEAIVFYKTYLGQALFHNCDVSKVNFSSVEWRKRENGGKRRVFEEVVNLDDPTAGALKPNEGDPDERDYGLIAELYQQLKKNYDERKDYWTAGDFHYGEMEMKRLHSRRKNSLARWFHQNLRLAAWYKYASEYGESCVRPAIWLAATLLVFALLLPAIGLRYDPAKDRAGTMAAASPVVLTYWNPLFPGQAEVEGRRAIWRLFGNSCLTSLQIAAFQKDPAYQPISGWGRLMSILEMLLTSTLAALFFLAVRRQFKR